MAYVEQTYQVSDVGPLLALSQQYDQRPGPGGSRITPAPLLDAVLAGGRAMLSILYPSSQMVAHRDPPMAGIRYHIPLTTNPGCWSFHEGTWQQLEVGHCYAMNQTGLHGSVNWGDTVRVHLMIDVG